MSISCGLRRPYGLAVPGEGSTPPGVTSLWFHGCSTRLSFDLPSHSGRNRSRRFGPFPQFPLRQLQIICGSAGILLTHEPIGYPWCFYLSLRKRFSRLEGGHIPLNDTGVSASGRACNLLIMRYAI